MKKHDAQCPKCGSREWKQEDGMIIFECWTLVNAATMEVDSQSPQCFKAEGRSYGHNENGECFVFDSEGRDL